MEHVFVVVEGISDAAIASRLLDHAGHALAAPPFITNGKLRLDKRIEGYNQAAKHGYWLVLRDLDHDEPCAGALVERLLPQRKKNMLLRVPVRMAEAWLLADRTGIAEFLGVPLAKVPLAPDSVTRPKRTLVDLARQSSKRAIREDMAPTPGTSAEVGVGYTTRIIEFASQHWTPLEGAKHSNSLLRCLTALKTI